MYKMKKVKVTDPRVDFDEKGTYVITDSATLIGYSKATTTNFTGNIVKFSQPISKTQALSSKMYVRCQFEVTLSGIPDPGTTLYQLAHDAPRFMPLAAITTNAVLSINSVSTTLQTNLFHDAVMRYRNNFEMISKELSSFPSMFDYYQVYSDYLQFGSGLNALGQIGEAGPGVEPRGGFPISIDDSDPNNVKITFETYEPVILPPLVWTRENHKSFIGVYQLDLTYNLGDINRVWSRSETNSTPVAVTARISNAPELYYLLQTPKLMEKIPQINIYPFSQIVQQSNDYGTVQPGQTINVTFNNQQLTGVPSKIYFFGRERNRTPFTTDTYTRIEQINTFNYDNFAGVFTTSCPQQLYQVCVENGYEGSFSDWYNYSGSIFCVDFSKDVPQLEYAAVGLSKNINFQIGAVMRNISSRPIDLQVNLVVVYEGVFVIDRAGATSYGVNLLTPDDVLKSQELQAVPYYKIREWAVEGGSLRGILSSAKGLARKAIGAYEGLDDDTKQMVNKGAKDLVGIVSPGLAKVVSDFGPEAYKVAKKLVGMGYSENAIYELLSKNASKGGKKITKAQLKAITRG